MREILTFEQLFCLKVTVFEILIGEKASKLASRNGIKISFEE